MRSRNPPPSLERMQEWAVSVLVGPHGGDVRDCIHAACTLRAGSAGRQVAVRDVSTTAAAALRRAAGNLHDVAREFGFDPTTHEDTADAAASHVLVLIASDFPQAGQEDLRSDLAAIAADLARTIRLTAEACAVRELMRGMIGGGAARADVLTAVSADAQPETVAILPDLWKALGGQTATD
jgi:hypothetical protein